MAGSTSSSSSSSSSSLTSSIAKRAARTERETAHGGPQSVGRVVGVLEHLVAHAEGASLAELAQATEAPKTSLVGLLQALMHER